MKIIILGANGMLGHTLFIKFSENPIYNVYGTLRDNEYKKYFDLRLQKKLLIGVDANNFTSIEKTIFDIKPNLIINCIGMIKQKPESNKIEEMYRINSTIPNLLCNICEIYNIRMIHVSTDCVFKGDEGNYNEGSRTDATDEYGKSKLKGEISDKKNVLTLRTSIVGHELNSNYSLLEWFLSQKNEVQGYKTAIFSGLTTLELFNVIDEYIVKKKNLYGLFHVGGFTIDKFSFLKAVAEIYNKKINIIPSQKLIINRSLDSSLFIEKTGYIKPNWYKMLIDLYNFRCSQKKLNY